jgi:glutathione peroxidase
MPLRCTSILALSATLLVGCASEEKPAAADTAAPAKADDPSGAAADADATKDPAAPAEPKKDAASDGGIHAFSVKNIKGETVSLGDYKGKVVMVVNTASECGFTNQYEGLQKLHSEYADKGLAVLGFPSNDFGGQEPGTESEIQAFVSENFGVGFPMFSKVKTKGDGQAELYRYLTQEGPEPFRGDVKWNFTKFLIDQQGNVVARFESPTAPTDAEVTGAIETLLGAS